MATSRRAAAYNLEITNIHTYHVGASEIVVHNTGCEPWKLKKFATAVKQGGPFNTKFYKGKFDDRWWTPDRAGHGESAFKVYRETSRGLEWVADADKYGNFLTGKWKGETGRFIPWNQLGGR